MNSILAVEKGLPPGLWLPTADEPTEKYLTENFSYKDRPYEDIVDYGAFVVALVAYTQDVTGRISLMPTTDDFDKMHAEGYGISTLTLTRRRGGIRKLQRALGFYPKGYAPDPDELLQRFQWIVDYAYDLDPYVGPLKNTEQLIQWGTERDLTPSHDITLSVLGYSRIPLRRILKLPEVIDSRGFTFLDVYRFGARVIAENNGPISRDELDKKYAGDLGEIPHQAIWHFFGTYGRFLLEFGYVQTTHGLSDQDIINLGVQRAIATDGAQLVTDDINQLSADKKFFSKTALHDRFEKIRNYREKVDEGYERYLRISNSMTIIGVSPIVVRVFCQNFEATTDYESKLWSNTDVMKSLSIEWESAKYVLSIIQKGFDLLDEHIMAMQVADFKKCLTKVGIHDPADMHFVFTMVPRIDADEAMKM
jgi:hypothetical protein